jgi:hypothetical protein
VAAGALLDAAELMDDFEELGIWVGAFERLLDETLRLELAEALDFAFEASWPMTPTRPPIPATATMLTAAVVVLIRRFVRVRTCAIFSIRSGAECAISICCSSLGGRKSS